MLWEELEVLRLGNYEKKEPPIENRNVSGLSAKEFLNVFIPADKWLSATFIIRDDIKFLISAIGFYEGYGYELCIENAKGKYETVSTYDSMKELLEKGKVNGQTVKELLPKITKISKFPLIPCG